MKGSLSTICNPFGYYNFYEKEIWLNFILVIILGLVFLGIGFVVFLIKFRDIRARVGSDKEIIERYIRKF